LEIVEMLVRGGARTNDQNQDGITVLHLLTRHKVTSELVKTIDLCLDKGCDINISNKFGETALYQAAVKLKIDLVNYLLSKGANPNIKSCTGDTILHKIICATGVEVIAIIKLLVLHGADVKVVGADGKKPLDMLAATPANKELLVLLCEAEKKSEEKKEESKIKGWLTKSLRSFDKSGSFS